MQKKLFALAVATVATASAMAQSNVTIYGVADAGVASGSAGANKFSGVATGLLASSRLGFKGQEDLGNGLKAIFTYEFGTLNIDSGGNSNNGIDSTRQSFVGLSNRLGMLTLGRQYAPGYPYAVKYNAYPGSIISPQYILAAAGGNTIGSVGDARWDNAVKYTMPTINGFGGELIYGLGGKGKTAGDETSAQRSKDNNIGLGLNYANGSLAVGYVYHRLGAILGNTNEHYLGATYDFGVVKLSGSIQKKQSDDPSVVDNKIYQVGAVVPVSAKGNVHFSYGILNPDGGGNNAQAATLAYTHGFSKRTTGYIGWLYNKNDNGGAANAGTVPGLAIAPAGNSGNLLAIGMNHTF
ncbi:MAG: porin [Gammaproteobacteria bacterium]|nr:porin [Gammaproteobacteria bacterium]MBU1846383.1 porin [Gammaproteobacteria bacterium]